MSLRDPQTWAVFIRRAASGWNSLLQLRSDTDLLSLSLSDGPIVRCRRLLMTSSPDLVPSVELWRRTAVAAWHCSMPILKVLRKWVKCWSVCHLGYGRRWEGDVLAGGSWQQACLRCCSLMLYRVGRIEYVGFAFSWVMDLTQQFIPWCIFFKLL
jgi:hypothetical protein